MASSRKVNKRLDAKRQRAVTRQALNGGRPRPVRTDKWGLRPDQPPITDQPSNGKVRKKKREPKPGCPGRRRHACLKDTVIERGSYPRVTWNRERGRFDYDHDNPITWAYERTFKLCVYCGKERTIRRRPIKGM